MFDVLILRTESDKAILFQQDLADSFKFFDRQMISHRTYVAVTEAGVVVGLAALVESSVRRENSIGVGFIETHRQHRQRGVARQLVEHLFRFAASEGKSISNTHYEPEGLLWLKPLMEDAAARHLDVQLYER